MIRGSVGSPEHVIHLVCGPNPCSAGRDKKDSRATGCRRTWLGTANSTHDCRLRTKLATPVIRSLLAEAGRASRACIAAAT